MRKGRRDFSSLLLWIPISPLLAGVSLEDRVLPGRGAAFIKSFNLLQTWLKQTPLGCHFLHGTAATWTKGGRPELLDGNCGTLELACKSTGGGKHRHGWAAVGLRKVHMLGEVGEGGDAPHQLQSSTGSNSSSQKIATGPTYPEEGYAPTQIRCDRPIKQVGCGFFTTPYLKPFHGWPLLATQHPNP